MRRAGVHRGGLMGVDAVGGGTAVLDVNKRPFICRESFTMAAGQAGKVPGAPPRNPTDARPRVRGETGNRSVRKNGSVMQSGRVTVTQKTHLYNNVN